MEDDLRQSVDRVRKLTAKLNALTDQVNDTFRATEKFLNEECSVGVPACVGISTDPQSNAGTYLEYRRVGSKFRIAFVGANDAGEDEWVKTWSDCTREEKLEAFSKLPELITAVAKRLARKIRETEKTSATLAEIVQALSTK